MPPRHALARRVGPRHLRRSVQFGGHQLVSRSAQWGWLRGWWRLVTFSGMDEWVAAVGAALRGARRLFAGG
ncbi:hypothetical protein, partial [Mycobacteroides abscessus]|uniref:hypothetical protein n=1 Tax=Mycobacteroides abscessus TaxID=36809 RepID=UPI001A99B152